jgi:hypothetical protein
MSSQPDPTINPKNPAMEFSYGSQGYALTRKFEGLRLTAYQDQVGVWTIGYGHTGPDVHRNLTITEDQADVLLHADIAQAVTCVRHAVTVSPIPPLGSRRKCRSAGPPGTTQSGGSSLSIP